jgi:hypothetical protein
MTARGYRVPFDSRVSPEPNTGCWLWTGTADRKGYGFYRVPTVNGGGNRRAHRFAWEREHGEVPEGLFVCHRCDNPACVNVDHLFLGSAAENNADRKTKGRSACGERSGQARLSVPRVDEIRRRHRAGESAEALARAFGVGATTVLRVVHGLTWKAAR